LPKGLVTEATYFKGTAVNRCAFSVSGVLHNPINGYPNNIQSICHTLERLLSQISNINEQNMVR